MSAFEGKTGLVDAAQVTSANINDIAKNFGLTVSNGQLYDTKGTIINPGVWVCKFDDGVIKLFTDDLFRRLFVKVEPPQYRLSDIPDFTRDIKRKGWGDMFIRNAGYCFVLYTQNEPIQPYQFTSQDFTADDWIARED